MPKLLIEGFDGVVPRQSDTMLADNQAQVANNVKLYSRELRYWRGATASYTPLISNVKTFYRYYASAADPYTLTWSTDVDIVTSPITDNSDYRLYYTGDGVPKKTNESLVTTGSGAYPRSWLNMGVPAPAAAPATTLSRTGTACTVTAATPGVFTLTAHGFANGQEVQFTATSMPGGLTAGTKYYVRNVTTDTFEVGATSTATTSVTTSSSGSGLLVYKNSGDESRVYVYTYVSTFGSVQEESAPSPASAILTVYTGDKVNVSGFSTAPLTNYNITSLRIYRSVTGATTDGYEFVDELAISTGGNIASSGTSTNGVAWTSSTYPDSRTSDQLGEALTTLGWTTPPSDMKGLVSLPSGALAGFSGNTVYFSEPFFPHAWPAAYALNIPHKVIGLGVFGTSVVVMTDRYPHIISGGIPGAMSVERVPTMEPCVAKRSIAGIEGGVLYASPNGLVAIGYNQRQIITNALFRRDEWQATNPQLIQAATYDGKYFGVYSSTGQNSFVLSPDDIPALSHIAVTATAMHTDTRTGDLYYVAALDNKVYKLDADENNPLFYEWWSKRFVLPTATSFSALKLDADFSQADLAAALQQQRATIIASNQANFANPLMGALNATAVDTYDVNGSILQNIPPTSSARTAQVYIYGEGQLQAVLSVTGWDPVRIPPFKSRDIEVRMVGNMNVRSIALATTVTELHQ